MKEEKQEKKEPEIHEKRCYNVPLDELLKSHKTSGEGLSDQQAKTKLEKYGYNELKETPPETPFEIFVNQFKSPIVWILVAAVVISFILGVREQIKHGGFSEEYVDAIVIFAILLLNAVFGFVQEYKAGQSIQALKKMTSLHAVVIRDGSPVKIPARELVPGDVIVLETGEKIPADSRLIEAISLEAQEAALTGESTPVEKTVEDISKEVTIGDQHNMVFSGTILTKGRGKAVVCNTGMHTEIGKIAHMIQTAETTMTPLQKKLAKLGKFLGVLVLLISLIVFLAGWMRGEQLSDMFLIAIALAVAAIPEGLPAVVTVALALGVKRMVKRNALMRHLPSVETLGCTSVICSDKTGTLTHNEMTVRRIYANGEDISVSGSGYRAEGHFSGDPKNIKLLLKIGALCNDAKLDKKNWSVIGDPTEGCLITSALKGGIDKMELEKEYPRIDEIQFDSSRKRMTTVHKVDGKRVAYVKGAVDQMLERCAYYWQNGQRVRLSNEVKRKILDMNEEYAKSALRVLGFAFKELNAKEKQDTYEKDMVFVGLQAMIDPPRKEVKDAVRRCHEAGIKVVMITGDLKTTAVAIAKELGIVGKAIEGKDLEKVDEKELENEVEDIAIYARVNPEHKMKIVNALQARGHIVAMTGDGVNDAPALKKADIGIAMGIAGTDVAKEASEMILTDDNFTSIVNAVEEGRTIFDNIRKFVEYLLSSNMGEVLTIFIAIVLGLPTPLIALHILWMNLITDGFPALALGLDPASPGIMKRKPRKVQTNVVDLPRGILMVFTGFVMMIGTLVIFSRYLSSHDQVYAQTVAFSCLVMFQLWNVLNAKGESESIFKVGLFNNRHVWFAIGTSLLLQFVIVYLPFFNKIFHTVPLVLMDWVYVVLVSFSVIILVEVAKAVKVVKA